MQKFSGDLAAKLLYGMPPTKINIISLANDINNSFLEPQQVFEPLKASYRLVTTGYQVPTLSPEVVARVLITVNTCICVYVFIYIFFFSFPLVFHSCNKSPRSILTYHNS